MVKIVVILISLFYLCHYGRSEKILGVFPTSHGSHYILSYKLMKGLADAGHDVTIVSLNRQKTPPKTKGTLNEIVLDGFSETYQSLLQEMNLFDQENQNTLNIFTTFINLFSKTTNATFYHPKVKDLLKSNQKFDAVILDYMVNDALRIFGHIYQCPVILLSGVGPSTWINPSVGNPNGLSYVRSIWLKGDTNVPITFLERTQNFLLYILDGVIRNVYSFPLQNKIIQQAFPGAPDIQEMFTNTSLVLLNSHISLYPAQALVPNMIEIGGFFIDPPKKLPQDLQNFLDDAPDGVIYFSMGSNLRSKDISEDKKNIILNVLSRLKQKVLWKFEEDLEGKPENVLIKKWLPQQDLLAHPNIRLFITHGGLLSTSETVYHGVPILAIPVFGDQPTNAEKAVNDGYALKLSYHDKDFTEETLNRLIQELLSNPKYKDTVQQRSRIFHDRPMKPLDTAVYWIEYIMRYNGAPHLKVASLKQPWYQYSMVDVIIFLISVVLIVTYILYIIFVKSISFVNRKISGKRKIKRH